MDYSPFYTHWVYTKVGTIHEINIQLKFQAAKVAKKGQSGM